jgi:C4-dicarboxylate-specific signal transduction histidine kinase
MYRREAEDMLRQSQKMEAIGQSTGGVAHDFNNLLTIISGNLEIADRCLQSWSDATRERLTRVIANAANGAQRAAMLTQRLLAFARRQPLDPKLTNVGQLIAGMSDFFRLRWARTSSSKSWREPAYGGSRSTPASWKRRFSILS